MNQGKSSVKIPPYYYPFKEKISILYPISREVKDKILREKKLFFFISRIVTNLPRVRGEIPLLFFPRTFWYKNPLILYNADKRNAKYTLISEFADKTVRAVSANYWRKSPKTHPNWNDHEYTTLSYRQWAHRGDRPSSSTNEISLLATPCVNTVPDGVIIPQNVRQVKISSENDIVRIFSPSLVRDSPRWSIASPLSLGGR